MHKVRPLLLASRSPQRRKLLKSLHVPFHVFPAKISEQSEERNPRRLVLELAMRKARHVAKRHPRSLVLGADTVVTCRGHLLLKPHNSADALRILSTINGRWHKVYTGVALIDAASDRTWCEAVLSRVKARKLDSEALSKLVGKHMDKAGAYAIQDREDPFIEKVIGPVDNVIGLPMSSVRRLITKAARKPLSSRRGSRKESNIARSSRSA